MTYRRSNLGQFEWLDSAADAGGGFDYGVDYDFGLDEFAFDAGDFAFDDFSTDFAFDDFGGFEFDDVAFDSMGNEWDFGFDDSFAFEDDWGSDFAFEDDWGFEDFELGGEEFGFDDFDLGDPWSNEFAWGGDDPFGTDALDVDMPSTDGIAQVAEYGSLPWNEILSAGVTLGTTILTLEAQKELAEKRQPTGSIAPSPITRTVIQPTSALPTRERINPYTLERELVNTRGTVIPSRVDTRTGKLVPLSGGGDTLEKMKAFVQENPLPILAGVGLLFYVLADDSTGGKRK